MITGRSNAGVLLALANILLLSTAQAENCTDAAPFVCPEGTACSEWSDGCNTCDCDLQDPFIPARCTMMYCSCYDDNSCVPECLDNTDCVPTTTQVQVNTTAKEVAEEPLCHEKAPFECPEQTQCTSWTDGCNNCDCDTEYPFLPARCSLMHCSCYEDDSCVPQCLDNPDCVPTDVAPVESEEPKCHEKAPFDCPEQIYCSEWTDGCNSCSCDPEYPFVSAMCTAMHCSCYDDNSCVPECHAWFSTQDAVVSREGDPACVALKPDIGVEAEEEEAPVEENLKDSTAVEETTTEDEMQAEKEGTVAEVTSVVSAASSMLIAFGLVLPCLVFAL